MGKLIVFQSFDEVRAFARGDMIDHALWKESEQDVDLTPAEKAENAKIREIARGKDKSARDAMARQMKEGRREGLEAKKWVLEELRKSQGGTIKNGALEVRVRKPGIIRRIGRWIRR